MILLVSGWTTDGQMFDSSVARGDRITFGLDQVIPGWTEGLQLMNVGEKSRFWIPEKLAYNGKIILLLIILCCVFLICCSGFRHEGGPCRHARV